MPSSTGIFAAARRPVASAAAWTPASLPSLVAWYDASDAATITDAGGGRVSQWSDKSGNGNHLVQGASGNQPLTGSHTQNSLNTIYFDRGRPDWLALSAFGAGSLAQPNTILIAMNILTTGTDRSFFDGYGSSSRHALGVYPTPKRIVYAGNVLDAGNIATGAQHWVAKFNGASSEVWINGSSVTTADPGSDALVGISMGAFNHAAGTNMDGDYFEAVVIDGAISAGDVTNWNTYMARWSL